MQKKKNRKYNKARKRERERGKWWMMMKEFIETVSE